MIPHIKGTALGVALVVGITLSACSSSDSGPDAEGNNDAETQAEDLPEFADVWEDAQTHMQESESLSMSARGDMELTEEIEEEVGASVGAGGTKDTLTFTGTSDGEQVELSMKSSELSLEVRGVEGDVFFRGNDVFYDDVMGTEESGDSEDILQDINDQWIQVPAGDMDEDPFASFYSEVLAEDIFGQDADDLLTDAPAEEVELEGETTLKYTGENDDGELEKFFFNEDHQLVKFETEEDGAPLVFTFSDWNEAPEVEAPGEEEILEIPEGF